MYFSGPEAPPKPGLPGNDEEDNNNRENNSKRLPTKYWALACIVPNLIFVKLLKHMGVCLILQKCTLRLRKIKQLAQGHYLGPK